jgi:Tol biopolymer transport system component
MSAFTLRWRWGLAVIGALSVVAITTAITDAAKPGGGSVPPGRIYYRWTSEVYADLEGSPWEFRGWWSMNADGSDKQLTPYQPIWSDGRHHLSYLTHQGHRWYLEIGPSPTYAQKSALFAVREDSDPDFTIVLQEAVELPGGPWPSMCRWAKDDSFISFVAKSSGSTVIAGIWVADIAFDELTGLPALVAAPVPVVDGEQPGWQDITSLDWSRDGVEVAYGLEPNGGTATVKIKNFLTGQTRVLANASYYPVWSPDGLKIAFKPFNQGVHTINPDGAGLLRITNNSWDSPTGWSPDGKHVLFWRGGYYKGNALAYTADVFRVAATGGSAVNLTKDIDRYATSSSWR